MYVIMYTISTYNVIFALVRKDASRSISSCAVTTNDMLTCLY